MKILNNKLSFNKDSLIKLTHSFEKINLNQYADKMLQKVETAKNKISEICEKCTEKIKNVFEIFTRNLNPIEKLKMVPAYELSQVSNAETRSWIVKSQKKMREFEGRSTQNLKRQ